VLFRDIIKLISITYGENAMGDMIEQKVKRDVFANKKSVRQSEFYQSMATGLRPEIMFEVRSVEYANEKKLEFNNKEYNIIREYSKNGEITELICQGLVNN
jgi:SPP1 family predicted phage head-tail adaptor